MSSSRNRLNDLSPDQKRALLAQRLRAEITSASQAPLSFVQRRLWFLAQLQDDPAVYHLPIAWRLTGPLDIDALEHSLTMIVERHDILHTTFPAQDGQPRQVIGPAHPVVLPIVDLQDLPQAERDVALQRHATAATRQAFDLAEGPVWLATLFRTANREHVLLLILHHMVFDAWSHDVFWQELSALYKSHTSGVPPALAALPIQYADFAAWQWQLPDDTWHVHLAYWQACLQGPLPVLALPTDQPHPPIQTCRGARQFLALPPALTAALKTLSQRAGVTVFMTLLAAFQTVLYRYTGQEDLLIGTPVAGRTRVETERLIGCFINTLVLRTHVGGNPRFRELLERVRTLALGAYAHQDMPFERLVEALQPERDLSRNPLFQVMFAFQNAPQATLALADLTVQPVTIERQTAMFDLTLSIWDDTQALTGSLEYRTDLFDDATMARLLQHFQMILQHICRDPEQRLTDMPLLTAAERQQVLVTWNPALSGSAPSACLHHIFETRVACTPDAIALVCNTAHLTYRVLDRRANQLAHHLQAMGVGPEVRIGLCMERSLELIVALLGILKAGGAYVPLDPAYPPERLAFMLDDARAMIVLTQASQLSRLPDQTLRIVCLDVTDITQERDDPVVSSVTAANLAYVMYTSGSTGKPKGVLVTHQGFANLAEAQKQMFAIQSDSRIIQFASLSFDASVWECIMALCTGARLCLMDPHVGRSGDDLASQLDDQAITHVTLPPSVLATLPRHALTALQTIIVAGEACPPQLIAPWTTHRHVFNAYGPTEATVCATVAACDNMHRKPSIGRSLPNIDVYVLDASLTPAPIGIPGELYIGGIGLARGYADRPAHTAAVFKPHPFSDAPGARLYKTGDLARYLSDGQIDFLGRLDQQVKFRGYRIELGEIEAVLKQHPAIQEAVVVSRAVGSQQARLVAYVISEAPPPGVHTLRAFLQTQLPDYMMPAAFVPIDTLPLTPSGKIDRQALPEPELTRPELSIAFTAPRNLTEEVLAGIWTALLGVETIGIHDNFFTLGGHSLLATQLMSRLRQTLQLEFPLRALFDAPTIAALALHIETAQQAAQGVPLLPIEPMPWDGPLPLSIAQEQLWRLDQDLPGTPFFNMPCALHLTGALRIDILEQSFNEIVRRHDSLRTTFTVTPEGQPVQVIAPTLSLALEVSDLRRLPAAERVDAAQQFAQESGLAPFDLARGPLLRVRLLQLAEQDYLLFVTMNHIISDGWSMGVLAHELAVLYQDFAAGNPSSLPALPIQYRDVVLWQHQWRHGAAWQRQLTYWTRQLHRPLSILELPTDRLRTDELELRTAGYDVALPQTLTAALKRLSHREGSTLFMTLLTAFNVFLHLHTRQTDLRVGSLFANRQRHETETLIGYFVNTVILRTNLSGNPTLRDILQRVRVTTLEAHAHQELPCEDLLQTLERDQGIERVSLFQTMFILQNAMQQPFQLPSLSLKVLGTDYLPTTSCDLVLMLNEKPQGLTGMCIYKPHLLDAATVAQMMQDFQLVIEHLCTDFDQPLSALGPRMGKWG